MDDNPLAGHDCTKCDKVGNCCVEDVVRNIDTYDHAANEVIRNSEPFIRSIMMAILDDLSVSTLKVLAQNPDELFEGLNKTVNSALHFGYIKGRVAQRVPYELPP